MRRPLPGLRQAGLMLAGLMLAVPSWARAQEPSKDAGTPSPAPEAARLRPGDGVDWKTRVLRVTGAGPPDTRASNPAQARLGAERSAKDATLRSLRALARQVPLRPGRTLGDAMSTPELKERVEKVLGGYRVAHHRYFSDGGVELEVEVPLSALAAAVGEPIEGMGKEGAGK